MRHCVSEAPDPVDQSSTPIEPDAGTFYQDGTSPLQELARPSSRDEDHGPPSAEAQTIYERYAYPHPLAASCQDVGGADGQADDVASPSHRVTSPSSLCEQNSSSAEASDGNTRDMWDILSKRDMSLFEYNSRLHPDKK